MKTSTGLLIAGGVTAFGIGAALALSQRSCPTGDVKAGANGSCPSGYVPDPSHPGCCQPVVSPPPPTPVLAVSPLVLTPSGPTCSGCFTLTVTEANPGDELLAYDSTGTYWGSTTADASGSGTLKACVSEQTVSETLTFYVQDFTYGVDTNEVTVQVDGGCGPDPCAAYGCGKDAACPAGCDCPSHGGLCYTP